MKKQHKHKEKRTTPNSYHNKLLQQTVSEFLDAVDCTRLNRNLHSMLMDYMLYNKDALPLNFELFIYELSLLFYLLNVAGDVQNKRLANSS